MSNPATSLDIANRWRPLTDEEQSVADYVLDDAWTLLQSRIPTLAARIAVDTANLAASTRMVLVAMALRVLRNPDGRTQESIEDYSYSVNQAVGSGLLYVTDDELGLLTTPAGTVGAFTITPFYVADAGTDLVWGSAL